MHKFKSETALWEMIYASSGCWVWASIGTGNTSMVLEKHYSSECWEWQDYACIITWKILLWMKWESMLVSLLADYNNANKENDVIHDKNVLRCAYKKQQVPLNWTD